MKKILIALFVCSALFAQAQKKSAPKKTLKKSVTVAVDTANVTEMVLEAPVVVEEIKDEPMEVAIMAVEEDAAPVRNVDGNEPYSVYNSYRERNLMIAYKGNDYDNRRYALLEYFSRKKITPFIFESISSFYEGEQSQAKLNGKYGVIDQKGKMIIPCIYDELQSFSIDGQVCYVANKNGREGIVNDQHEVLLPFDYDNIVKTHSPIHLVVTANGKSGVMHFISRKMIIPMQYDRVEVLSSSNMIRVKRGADYTLFNMTGEQVFNSWYQRLDVNDDQTVVASLKGKEGLITLSEKKVTPFEYDRLERTYATSGSKYIYIAQKAGKYGVVTSDGKITLPLQYDELQNPRSDLCIVSKGAKKGLVAVDGKQLLPVEYDDITYAEKYFLVKKNGKTGITNREGEMIIPVEYDVLYTAYMTNDYSSTLFLGTKNGKKGMIDAINGKVKLEFAYDDIIGTRRSSYSASETFTSTIIAVKNGKYGMIELNGNIVVPFEYDDLQYLNSFVVIAKKNGKYGIRDIYNGTNVLLPFEYQFVNHKNGIIVAYKDVYEKYRVTSKRIIPIE